MKNILFLLALAAFFSCKKTNEFSGKVIDFRTGLPIDSVYCTLGISALSTTGGGSDIVGNDYATTDSTGMYLLQTETARSGTVTFKCYKLGYVQHYEQFLFDQCREKDIQMYPNDAWLDISLINQTSDQTDVACSINALDIGHKIGYGPFSLQPNGIEHQIINIPGGLDITVYWTATKGSGGTTVFCPHGDTTSVVVHL